MFLFSFQGFPGGSVVKNLPIEQETWVQSLDQEDSLEEQMAAHSSILSWESHEQGAWQATVQGVAKSQTWLSTHVPSTYVSWVSLAGDVFMLHKNKLIVSSIHCGNRVSRLQYFRQVNNSLLWGVPGLHPPKSNSQTLLTVRYPPAGSIDLTENHCFASVITHLWVGSKCYDRF